MFYSIGSGWYTLLLLLSLVVNFWLSHMIGGLQKNHPQKAKHYFIGGMIYNFGWLAIFKYTNFLVENLNALLSAVHIPLAIPAAHLIMPLGISFFTFRSRLISLMSTSKRSNRQTPFWSLGHSSACSRS